MLQLLEFRDFPVCRILSTEMPPSASGLDEEGQGAGRTYTSGRGVTGRGPQSDKVSKRTPQQNTSRLVRHSPKTTSMPYPTPRLNAMPCSGEALPKAMPVLDRQSSTTNYCSLGMPMARVLGPAEQLFLIVPPTGKTDRRTPSGLASTHYAEKGRWIKALTEPPGVERPQSGNSLLRTDHGEPRAMTFGQGWAAPVGRSSYTATLRQDAKG